MKQITAFLLVILSLSSNAQNETDIVSQLNELTKYAGKVYVLLSIPDTLNQNIDTIYLGIMPDKWETYSFKVGYGFSPNRQTTFEVSQATVKPVKRRASSSDKEFYFKKLNASDVQAVSFAEVPARDVSFKPLTIIENGDTIITVPTQKVKARRLVQKGGFKYVSKEEALKMDKNDVYAFIGKIKAYEYFHRCGLSVHPKITNIQKALNEKGYECPIDGILGSVMKKALIEFQKDNNLKEGRLSIETLKALGVE